MRKQYEIRFDLELGPRHSRVVGATVSERLSLETGGVNSLDAAVVAGERGSHDAPRPVATLFMGV